MLEFPGPDVFQAVVDRIETGVYVIDAHRAWCTGTMGQRGLRAYEPRRAGASLR